MEENILIVYYSWSGNTRTIASLIRDKTGGILFEIQPEIPYVNDYNAVVTQAKKEIHAGYSPALNTSLNDITPYDTIYIGSPNWWSTIAPPVKTFLSGLDFSGKTILPFLSHGGGGRGRIIQDISDFCTGANILDALEVSGDGGRSLQTEVSVWLRKTGIVK